MTSVTYPEIARRSATRRRRRLSTVRLVRLVREGSFAAPDGYPDIGTPIRCPRDVYACMAPYAEREAVEAFWILPLDSQHRLAGAGPAVITRGILNSSLVHPREVFRAAIEANAAAIVLVHNHPSGDPTPSADDVRFTASVAAAADAVGVPLVDHVVVARDGFASVMPA